MHKTAAQRSIARRAVLTKQAGIGGKALGVLPRYMQLLRGSSIRLAPYRAAQQLTGAFGDLVHVMGHGGLDEVAKAKLQLALAALRSDGIVGNELRKVYATRAGTGAAALGGLALLSGGKEDTANTATEKKAETAYIEGFCKAAEAMGVDPRALAKTADEVSDWVNNNLPDYTTQERLVQELRAKKGRGIDIEKYRTSNVGNWAGILGSATAGTFGTATALNGLMLAEERGSLRGAKDWIRSVRKLAPGFSARHRGVAKAIGRLANTGTKTGLVAAVLLPLVGGMALGSKFNNRRHVNKAIDQVQGAK